METLPPALVNLALVRVAGRVPVLRQMPLFELVMAVEVAMLARAHYERLTPAERRRIVLLVRETGGRPSRFTPSRRRELAGLIAKAEPRLFLTTAAQRLSPLSLRHRR